MAEEDEDDERDPEGPEDFDLEEPDQELGDPCPHCRKLVYEEAERCPYCGQYIVQSDRPAGMMWLVITGVVIVISLLWMFLR